ncbi:AAA family ATPase [Oceanobacillus saliphilus]|uniref:AAA family ATPase n=1 Tax=Oceanobacillus saliphilus TaxID=2925834 RepID=UPI00201D2ED8|nr:AAA family ATPase [Oceanobacillus saliphilus]
MLSLYSIADNDRFTSTLEKAVNEAYQINWVSAVSTLKDKLQPEKHSVVLLPDSSSYDIYSLCTTIIQEFPKASVLLFFEDEADVNMKKVIRAGAGDVIFLSAPSSRIKEDIHLAIENSEKKMYEQTQSGSTKDAKVITVASTKGGIGKTTIAVNIAASFGKKLQKVAIVDLDLQFGDVALFLDMKPKRTIYDWIKEDHTGTQIENFMTTYKDGISVLAAPQRPEFAEVITGSHVQKAIDSLKKHYDIVVIDASVTMDEKIIVALESSDDILVMTYLDLPTLKNTKLLMDTFVSLEMESKVKLILNRQMKVKGMKNETAEKVLGQEIFTSLPAMDKLLITSVNEGQPITYSNPRTKFSKGIFKMAEALHQTGQPMTKKNAKKNKQQLKKLADVGGHA